MLCVVCNASTLSAAFCFLPLIPSTLLYSPIFLLHAKTIIRRCLREASIERDRCVVNVNVRETNAFIRFVFVASFVVEANSNLSLHWLPPAIKGAEGAYPVKSITAVTADAMGIPPSCYVTKPMLIFFQCHNGNVCDVTIDDLLTVSK